MSRNQIKKSQAILFVSFAVVFGVLLGLLIAPRNMGSFQGDSGKKLNQVFNLLETQYVETLNTDSLIDKTISSLLYSLDPHSRFLTAQEYQRETEEMRGNFQGIGATLRSIDDTVYIGQILPNSPASRSPLRPGDQIVRVDKRIVAGKSLPIDSVVKLIRGPHNTQVSLGIKRYGEDGVRNVTLFRGTISNHSVLSSSNMDKIGYIRLLRFNETSYSEFHQALNNLKKKQINTLILDLRGNGGGLLDAAIRIVDELLPDGNLIVYTQGAHEKRSNAYSHKNGLFTSGNLAILIDESSASASEIVAGAIQDNDRGIILGRRSFGKGLVQHQYDLPGNSAALLTVARYYTPSGRCIQRPYDKGSDEYYADYLRQVLTEQGDDSLLVQVTDTTKYFTKNGRVVYAGGGILPDYTLRLFTDTALVYYNRLLTEAVIQDFSIKYVHRNGATLMQKYPTSEGFVNNFKVTDAMVKDLLCQADKKIPRNNHSLKKYYHEICVILKATIANNLYGDDVYYQLTQENDVELQQAVKLIKKHYKI